METTARKPDITWKTVTRKVGELCEWDDNPRVITEFSFNQLVESIIQDGYHNRIKITQDNLIIGGHQRKRALLAAGLTEDTPIEVLQACEPLKAEDFARINIRDNLAYGQFDFDKLANMYTPIQLIEWHMPQDQIGLETPNFQPATVDEKTDRLDKKKTIICPECRHEFES
jgi:hypothetical protein